MTDWLISSAVNSLLSNRPHEVLDVLAYAQSQGLDRTQLEAAILDEMAAILNEFAEAMS